MPLYLTGSSPRATNDEKHSSTAVLKRCASKVKRKSNANRAVKGSDSAEIWYWYKYLYTLQYKYAFLLNINNKTCHILVDTC